MTKITVYESAFCRVDFEEAHRLMTILWNENCQEILIDELLPKAEEIAGLSYLYTPTISISDMRFVPVIDPESQAWLDKNLTPIYVSNGLRKSAMIIKPEDFSLENLSFEQLMEDTEIAGEIRYRFFKRMEDARAWVLQKN